MLMADSSLDELDHPRDSNADIKTNNQYFCPSPDMGVVAQDGSRDALQCKDTARVSQSDLVKNFSVTWWSCNDFLECLVQPALT